jgi:hypothetical protein
MSFYQSERERRDLVMVTKKKKPISKLNVSSTLLTQKREKNPITTNLLA